jgi:hypothetical protein
MDDGLKYLGLEPPFALLVHCMLGRQVMRHYPPCGACPYDPAQTIKDLVQTMVALRRIVRHGC